MAKEAATQAVVAALLTLLLFVTSPLALPRRLGLVALAGFAACAATYWQLLNWWGLPAVYGIGVSVNLVGAWLAGRTIRPSLCGPSPTVNSGRSRRRVPRSGRRRRLDRRGLSFRSRCSRKESPRTSSMLWLAGLGMVTISSGWALPPERRKFCRSACRDTSRFSRCHSSLSQLVTDPRHCLS